MNMDSMRDRVSLPIRGRKRKNEQGGSKQAVITTKHAGNKAIMKEKTQGAVGHHVTNCSYILDPLYF